MYSKKSRFWSLLLVLSIVLSMIVLPASAFEEPFEVLEDVVTVQETIGLASAAIGNESFQRLLEVFPGILPAGADRTAPVFTYATTGVNLIQEVIYVEVPVDTDGDGKRDLIRVTVRRPVQSNQEGVNLPSFYEMSPYRDGTLDRPFWEIAFERENPREETIRPKKYEEDIESLQPRASEWYWGDEEVYWDPMLREWLPGTPPGYEFGLPNPMINVPLGYYYIPAAREPVNEVPVTTNPGTAYGAVGGTFAQHMYTRGVMNVSSNSIGNARAEGLTSCGDVDETLVAAAVINWLGGKPGARGFTSQTSNVEMVATSWSNGNVVMSGTSYNGTIPIAAAASGVEGLKAIIPIAAISTWYDYYRQNGSVKYPGRNNPTHQGFPGEEFDDLAILCFSRVNTTGNEPSSAAYRASNAEGERLRAAWLQKMNNMARDQDIWSGDYNRFMDDRNYMATADQITAGIIIQHGFEDFNVNPSHFDKLWRSVKEMAPDTPMKAVLHRAGHTSISTHAAFFDWGHKWLDHFLWGIENNVVEDMPNVQISCSIRGTYESFDSWPIPGSAYTRYYLNPDDGIGAAGSLSLDVPVSREFVIQDDLLSNRSWLNDNTLRPWPTPWISGQAGHGYRVPTSAHINNWESRIYDVRNLELPSDQRVAFVMPITENIRVNGTIVASIEVATDRPWGNVTAALVEINSGVTGQPGSNGRLQPGSTTVRTIAANNGVAAISLTSPTAMTTPAATGQWRNYRLLTSGTADIQNPNSWVVTPEEFPHLPGPRGRTFMEAASTNFAPEYYWQSMSPEPGVSNVYTFMLETYDWELMAGNQVAVMIYSTDYRYTLTPTNPPELTIITGPNTFLDIPATSQFNTTVPDHFTPAIEAVEAVEAEFEVPFFATTTGRAIEQITLQLDELLAAAGYLHYTVPQVVFMNGSFFIMDPLGVLPPYQLNVFSAVPSAFVTQLNGNTNDLTITVNKVFTNGTVEQHARIKFSIRNNAEGTYAVGDYNIFVDTKGNTQIRDIRIVGVR